MKKDSFKIANTKLKSRLIVGTGKYKNFIETAKAVEASGASMVTVAVRRVNIIDKKTNIDRLFKSKKIILLPNTAGCFTSEEPKNFEISKRNGWMEVSKIRGSGYKNFIPKHDRNN